MNLACSRCGYLYEYQAQTGSLSTGHPTPQRQLQVQDARRKTNSLGSIHTDTWHSQQSRTANLVISLSFPLADGYLSAVPSNPRVAAPFLRPSLPLPPVRIHRGRENIAPHYLRQGVIEEDAAR